MCELLIFLIEVED